MKKLLLLIILTTMSLSLSAQSDDGWFTDKLSVCYAGNPGMAGVDFQHLYNIENHHSIGMGIGCRFQSRPVMPLTAVYRLRPLGHKTIMPVATVSGGIALTSKTEIKNSGISSLRLGLETGHLSRIRYSMDVGIEFMRNSNHITATCGIIF